MSSDKEVKHYWILRDFSRCSGCRLCEVVCSLEHEGRIWPEASRIRVMELFPGVNIPVLCSQCSDYPCVKSCPINALSVDDKTGAVIVDESKCDGCGVCIVSCPAKALKLHPAKRKVIVCDLCGGSPRCVEVCNSLGFNALRLVTKYADIAKAYATDPLKFHELIMEKLMGGQHVRLLE